MPLKTHADEQPTLNLTSMIDIVFLLIIFFMVGTKFTELEKKIGLSVPQVSDSGALTAAPQKKVIQLYREGLIELDRQHVTLSELTQRLSLARQQYPELGVVVRGDSGTPLQKVADVLSACKQAGVGELAIAVRVANPQR